MLFSKRTIPSMFFAVVMGVASLPHSGFAQDTTDAVVSKLSPETVEKIRSNPEEALRVLMEYAFLCSSDGIVTIENDAVTKSIDSAQHRIRFVQPFLMMDLDADGQVTRDEFNIYSRTQAPRSRAKSEVTWNKTDSNNDGVITIAEMLAHASEMVGQNQRRSSGMRGIPTEILKMDVDGDGQVTIDEITTVVQALSI